MQLQLLAEAACKACLPQIIIDPDTFNAPAAKLRVVFDAVDRVAASDISSLRNMLAHH